MSFLVSPGVQVREIDLTTIVPSVSTTEGAIGGVFRWGPINQRILVDSEVDLVKRFGKPTNLNAETWFTCASFLAYANRLFISRAANTAGISPTVSCTVEAGNNTVIVDNGDTLELKAGLILVESSDSGLKSGAIIEHIINTTAFTIVDSDDALANTTTDACMFVSNTVFTAVANTASVANLEYCIVKNDPDFEAKLGTFDTDVKFIARFPGEMGNSLRVSICGNSAGHSSTINLASFGTTAGFTVDVNSNTASFYVTANAIASASANTAVLRTLINVTDLVEVGNTLFGSQYMKVTEVGNATAYGTSAAGISITTTAGETLVTANNTTNLAAGMRITTGNAYAVGLIVNNVANSTAFYTTTAPEANLSSSVVTVSPLSSFTVHFEDEFKLAESFTYSSANTATRTFNRYWEFFGLVDSAPGQSEYVLNFGNSSINSDEIHVVVVDNNGKFTGTPGTVLETYRAVSRATDGKTVDGASNYWKAVINDASQFIYATNDVSGIPSATAEHLVSATLDIASMPLGYGRDGKDETNIEMSVITNAYDMFRSVEDVDVSLILTGKSRSFLLANYLIDNIAEIRQDCVVFCSPQKGDVVNNVGNEADACVNFRDNLRSTSYAMMDSGYKYMYDKYNDLYRWIPLNGDIAGLCVRTDYTNDPWWSIAGFNRGQIKNVIKLAFNPRQAHRDTLYKAGINPVVTFPGQGTVLFGDKTLLAKPSAFDRINVRRLFIVLEKAISAASKYTLFEFNDAFTRAQFRNLVVPYLRDIQGRRGITDFLVVCDETNNTPEVIDRNEFVGDIYIKPARSINFIQLNFIAVRTGVAFSEVVGKW